MKKKKVKKEEKGEEAPPPAPEPEPEPAPPPSAPTSTKSSRHSSKRKAVKRSGSNVFSLFTTQQVAEFKEVSFLKSYIRYQLSTKYDGGQFEFQKNLLVIK